ncbi:MAG: GNAT family N-acetyltransferase [Herpetosiphonaceae bacterium]|nr:GNAT family N-acetyltransferase [Herpetosiphonaceae bacterium]
MAGRASNSSTGAVLLRDVTEADLPIFFEQQRNREANRMAAFTARDPEDRAAFMAHWTKVLADESITKQTIVFEERVAGNIVCFMQDGHLEVGYWIGKEYWGKGIATKALLAFLNHVPVRPLYAYVAKDNAGSLRVLQKCGFTMSGEGKEYSNARGAEVEAWVLILRANVGYDRAT